MYINLAGLPFLTSKLEIWYIGKVEYIYRLAMMEVLLV